MLDRILQDAPRFFTYYNAIFYLQALAATFGLAVIGSCLGFVGGAALAILRRSSSLWLLPLRILAIVFVECFRRIPYLVTLMLVFFSFSILAIDVSLFTVGLIAVCLVATAYLSEIVRAGFDSVHRNQIDAAQALNLTARQTLIYIIVPQSWKVVIPPMISFMVLYTKDTALASQIGVHELTYAGKIFNSRGFSPVLSFGTVLVLYFLLSYPLGRFGAWLETRLAAPRNR